MRSAAQPAVAVGRARRSLRSLSRPPLNASIVGQTAASMKKDARLHVALAALRDRFGDSIEIVDHWDADLLAVGVARRGHRARLVYIAVLPKHDGHFDVALEVPAGSKPERPYE